jgi:hypothetical protein
MSGWFNPGRLCGRDRQPAGLQQNGGTARRAAAFSGRVRFRAGPERMDCVEEVMNARLLGKMLGASAALAVLVPVAVSPASAQAWYPGPRDYGYGQGYRPGAGYPPAPDYATPPAYAPQDMQPQTYGQQEYPPPQPYEPEEAYPPQRYAAPERYGAEPGYGPGEAYGPEEGTYGANNPSLYRTPGVPPGGRGYAGSSRMPRSYGPEYPEAGWEPPRTGWSSPPPQTGRYAPSRSERLVSAIDVNLRAGPSNSAPVLTVLPAGTPVHIAGPGQGGWVQVDSPRGRGWVYGRYLAPA